MKHWIALPLLAACGLAGAQGTPAMSAGWAKQMCQAWNQQADLTGRLVDSGWVRNDGGRGYKTMQIWRADCADSPRIEMRIALKDGKALCVYGGAAGGEPLHRATDYQMWAQTARWREMGAGDYGPMKAMMFGRLQFDGPKLEAMNNMAPFSHFLRLVGKVQGDWGACP